MELMNFEHQVILKNKNNIEVIGIEKIDTLTKDEIVLLLKNKDYFSIQGKNLEMLNLNNETGSIKITGEVYKMFYDNKDIKRKKDNKSFIEKLFK